MLTNYTNEMTESIFANDRLYYLATSVSNEPVVGFFLTDKKIFKELVEYNLKSSIVSFSSSKSPMFSSNKLNISTF